jgi:exodeoxyribonuclease V alpha subunit
MVQSSLRAALLQRVRGIGPERAKRLLETFGNGIDTALSDPDNTETVAEVIAPERPLLGRHLASQLKAQWREALQPEYEAMDWLDRQGITDSVLLARRIVRILGSRTRKTLESNPYILSKILPWPKIDEIGRRVLIARTGYDEFKRAPKRILGAVDNAIGEWLSFGHTAVPKTVMAKFIADRLGREPKVLALAERLGVEHGRMLDGGDFWRFRGCAFLENQVLYRLEEIRRSSGTPARNIDAVDRAIATAAAALPSAFSDEQVAAVRYALLNPFSVIAGGAGTGKTATLHALAIAWEALGGCVHLCALAGKAALRLGQATHRLAFTIHRTLAELALRENAAAEGKRINPDWAELTGSTLVVVDEASMVDLGQWARLLKAMPQGCGLVMVGDTAQLPPIGFGLLFHVLAYGSDAVSLTKIYRQDEASGIPAIAESIRRRQQLCLPEFSGVADGASFFSCRLGDIESSVEAVVQELGGFGEDGLALHVVAATNQRVASLNRRFHDLRRGAQDEVKGYLGAQFCVGDPVVHLENDYKRALFNGMLGVVVGTNVAARSVTVIFEGESHDFGRDELIRLDLAYALTCHKLQGSQATRILVVLEPTRLLEPSWLYTAMTRAQNQAVIVGPRELLRQAVSREFAWKRRFCGYQL